MIFVSDLRKSEMLLVVICIMEATAVESIHQQ